MLDLAECWEPRVFFIQDFALVSICCYLYVTMKKQKKSQESVEQDLPK